MAEKKTARAARGKDAAPAGKREALEAAMAQIEKQFGKGAVMRLGENVAMQVESIPTGSLSLEGFGDIGNRAVRDVVGTYRCDRSRDIALPLYAVADYDGSLEEFVILCEDDVDRGPVAYGYGLCHIADTGVAEGQALSPGNIEGVGTVHVRNRTGSVVILEHHRGSDYGKSLLINDLAADGASLCEGGRGTREREQHGRQAQKTPCQMFFHINYMV